MLDHQHKVERRQQWWSGVAMYLPVGSSSILTVVMLLTGYGWGATVAPAAAGVSAGVVLGRDQVKRRRGKSDPAAVPPIRRCRPRDPPGSACAGRRRR